MKAFESGDSVDTRAELRQFLLDQRQSLDHLLRYVDDPSVAPVHLVELVESLEQFDGRRSHLIRSFREEVSELRRREEERSVRQFVLRALEYVDAPQPAGFLQEFVWARERVDLDTRGFGALRRDEARAWRRRPGQRVAYIVPALDSDGHALARWMARSDWPLPRRLVVDGAEHLFGVKRLNSLLNARDELPSSEASDPYTPLLQRYALEILTIEPPPDQIEGDEPSSIEVIRRLVQDELAKHETFVNLAQREAEKRLAHLSEERQLWGL